MQRLKLAQLGYDEDLIILQENDLEFIKGGGMMLKIPNMSGLTLK